MELNQADMLVIVNTLHSSLKINDDGRIFMFAKQSRNTLLNKIIKQLAELGIVVELKEEPVEPSKAITHPDQPPSSAG